MYYGWGNHRRRALDIQTANAGSNAMLEESVLGDGFIEVLRAQSPLIDRCRIVPATQGNISVPRMTASATIQKAADESTTAISEQNPSFDSVTLSPQQFGARVGFSRLTRMQSDPDFESVVRMDIMASIREQLETEILHNTTKGVLAASGVPTTSIATNGGSPTRDHLLSLWDSVAKNNGLTMDCAFYSNSKVVKKLMQTRVSQALQETASDTFSSQPVDSKFVLEPMDDGMFQFLACPFVVSNHVKSDLTKGTGDNLSAIGFGDFSQYLLGFWDSTDVILDEVTQAAKRQIFMTVWANFDVAIRQEKAFAKIVDASTS